MAKQQTFSDKVAKAQSSGLHKCPVCDTPVTHIRVISPTQQGASGGYRFQRRIQAVCKCNSAEVLGN
ncbi:MAG: hypothetical protein NTW14_06540 [bacterium]|nr:hypothetical protein [bacterium]